MSAQFKHILLESHERERDRAKKFANGDLGAQTAKLNSPLNIHWMLARGCMCVWVSFLPLFLVCVCVCDCHCYTIHNNPECLIIE